MSKTKKIIAITVPIAVIVIVLVAVLVYFFACSGGPVYSEPDNFELELFDYRIGYIAGDAANNTVDLTKAIPNGSDFTVTGDAVTLEGTNLTAVKAGTASLTYNTQVPDTSEGAAEDATVTASKTVTVTVMDGYVNVDTWEEFYDAAMNNGSEPKVVVQADLIASGAPILLNGETDIDTLTVYGNTRELYAYDIVKDNVSLFSIEYTQATMTIEDLHIVGEYPENEDQIDLTQFEGNGAFFVAYGSDDVFPVINVNHCLTENGQKHAYVRAAELNVNGSYMKNGADAIIAAETSNVRGAVVNLENSVIANSVVCGVILCGWNEVRSDADYCTLNIEGFVDFFTWKNRETTRLMPSNEKFAGVVNSQIGREIKKSDYDDYFVSMESDAELADQFLNIGIIRLATGGLNSGNKSAINGYENIGFELKDFPLPELATSLNIIKSCHLIGMAPDNVDWSSVYHYNPNASIGNNANINYELVNGRQ